MNNNPISISNEKNSLSWTNGENRITVSPGNIISAILTLNNQIFVAIKGTPEEIKFFTLDGTEIGCINMPRDLMVMYLVEHSKYGLCAACSSDEPLDGRYDWFYQLDVENKGITRMGPAY